MTRWHGFDERGVLLSYRWPGLPKISFGVILPKIPKDEIVWHPSFKDFGLLLQLMLDQGLAPTPEPCEATRALDELWEI